MHDFDDLPSSELCHLLLAEADLRMAAVSDAARRRAADRILAIAAVLASRGLSPCGAPLDDHRATRHGAVVSAEPPTTSGARHLRVVRR